MRESFLLTIIVMIVIVVVFAFLSTPWIHQKIKLGKVLKDTANMVKMYTYETYHGAVNQVLIIEDSAYKNELEQYYHRVELHDESASFDFPLKTLPENEPVFILGYSKDSLLVEVVSFYDREPKFGGDVLVGFVLKRTLHASPPN